MRRASRLALAAVIGLIALWSQTGAATADSGGSNGAPKSLTDHFPLGSQTLSRTKTARGAAATPHPAPATSPHRSSTATPTRPRTTQAAGRHDSHGTSSALFLLVIPALIVAALLIRAARRGGRRDRPARWAYQSQDEPADQAPPLPIREREPPPLPIREREPPPLPIRGREAPSPVREREAPSLPVRRQAEEPPG